MSLVLLLSGTASAQTPQPVSTAGLPQPSFEQTASLKSVLALLDGSAGSIVAEVGTRPITWGDVADAIRAMPPIVAAVPLQQLYQNATVQLMQQEALALDGERAGLGKDPTVQRRIRNATDQVVASEVLRRSLAPNITDNALHALYNGLIAGKPGPDEVRARLIMVATKDEAVTLIQRIQNGADFSAIARDFSKDGTASTGGDLGFASLEMLAPEIGSVVFALAPGQMTAFPVRSSNSWFIIRIEARSERSAPTFEEARPALEQDVIHAGIPVLKRLALQPGMVKYFGAPTLEATGPTPK